MPPGRRKVGSQGETKSHFSAGDLVLAKVKGFPAWPAKICKPEDWDRSPDPKKFFVQFFGTSEIAFVAPADIQVFSLDSKSKLVVRSRGKCAKDFGRAVEEICKAYEHLHGKISEKHNADVDRSMLRDNRLDEASKSEDSEHSREVEEGGTGELVSESPSKFSLMKDEKSPSSCPEGGKNNHIAVYFRGKMSDSKLKASTVNEKTTKFQKNYEPGIKFEDARGGKPADVVDEKRAKLYHSSASDSNTTGDNRSKVSRKSEKAPLGDIHKNAKLSTNQERDKNITAILGDHSEKKTPMSNRKRGLDASEQSHAKRTKHDYGLDVKFSGTNNQRRDKTSMDKFSVTVSTEGAEHERSSGFVKKEELLNQKKSPAHILSRRRTFRIDDDEDDEVRRTPVHKKYGIGGSPKPNEKFDKDKMAIDKTGNRLQLTQGHSEERRPANFFMPNIMSKIVESKVKSSTDLSIKSRTVSSKHSNELHRFNHATNLKAMPHTLDKTKGTQWNAAMENRANVNYSAEHSTIVNDFSSDERSAALFAESHTAESATSMRHLIAVAQAKRRETYLQGHPNDRISSLLSSPAVVRERSPSPLSEIQHISDLSFIQKGKGESFSSPFTAEEHEHSASPGILPEDVANDATEAAVARDALEGMIETLSRTRESIGRATRLAIDCAKYGIAREVVDLLVQKLENETSHHRKVDLFFLVDSITQCSHSQKGVAGESFVPSVQNALHRLLAAAVPAGSTASENRRQCLKVLRLWLERKIFPESVLRPLIEEIEFPHDGSNSALPLRRPSRAERSIDDPIRDMEGILVDEYGSNVAFNLPNFISSRVFEEEEGLPRTETPTEFATTVTYQSEDAYKDIIVSFRQQAEFPEINENPHHLYSAQRAVPSPLLPLDSPPAPPPLPLDSPPSLPPLPSSPLPPSPPPPPSSPPPPPPPPPPPYPQHSSFPQSDTPTNKDYSYTPSGQTHALQLSPGRSRSVECNGQPYEFVQNSMSIEHQTGLSSQQFQPAVTSFSQGSMKSFPVPSHQVLTQYPSSATQPKHHFARVNSMSERHNACSLSSDSKGRVHYIAEECRRKHSGTVILESQQSSRVTGETAASGAAYDLDGLDRPNVDRPPQEFHSLHSVAPASGPHNRWRPS